MKKFVTMLIAVSIAVFQVSDCFADTFRLLPDADTFIDMSKVTDPPTISNIGSATRLEIKDVETNAINADKISYIRFNLSNVTGDITSASLKLVFKGAPATTLVPKFSLYKVNNDDWAETGLAETWTSRTAYPLALGDKIGGDYDITVANDKPIIIDVTEYIREEYKGDGIATFAITGCNDQRLTIEFYSKDYNTDANFKPSLIIDTIKPLTINDSAFTNSDGTVIHKLSDCTNEVSHEITVTNNSMGTSKLSLILALFSKNGDLKKIAYQKAENRGNGETVSLKARIALDDDFAGCYAAAFLWDDITSQQPIANCVTLPYNTAVGNNDRFSEDSIEYATGGVKPVISDCVSLTEPINANISPIVIKGVNTQGANKKVTIVIKENGSHAENTDPIFYINQTITDKDGKFQFSFNAPQVELSKNYSVNIGAQNLTGVLTTDFNVYNINSIIDTVNKSGSAEYLKNNIFLKNEYKEILISYGLLLDEFGSLGDGINSVCELISDYTKNAEFTKDTLREFFNRSVVVQMINNVENLAKEEQNSAIESIFNNYSETLAVEYVNEWIVNKIIDKLPNVSTNFIEALVLLDKINTGRYTIISLLSDENNARILGITNSKYYKKYIDMTEDEKENVHKDIFMRKPFETQIELQSEFDYVVSNMKIVPSKSSGSNSKATRSVNISNVQAVAHDTPIVPQQESTVSFVDVSNNDWAYEYIQTLVKKGIVSGWGNQFRPYEKIKREEFLKMLLNAFNLSNGSTDKYDCNFNDVDKNSWYYPFVSIAYNLGITKGESENDFGIGKDITREEMAVQINRIALLVNLKLGTENEITDFIDKDSIEEYAVDSVVVMQKAGIINGYGDNSFKPKDGLTRAEAAKVIVELIKYHINSN